MRIRDTYPEIETHFPTDHFSLPAWRAYAATISATLAGKVEADTAAYDFGRDVLPLVRAALTDREQMRRVHESFAACTGNLQARMEATLGLAPDADIILYLGLGSGAGWATALDSRPAVLLGIEKIIELDWCDRDTLCALVYHELGHLWHDAMRGGRSTVKGQNEKALWQLYREGIAMRCEQLLLGNTSAYHQDRDGWLEWCRSHEDEIKREYLRRMRAGESTQDFFGDWENYEGHADVGYYLGCAFVGHLLRRYTLAQAAILDTAEILREFVCYAGGENDVCHGICDA